MNEVAEPATGQCLSRAEQHILKMLLYYDIFSFPLTAPELQEGLSDRASQTERQQALASLMSRGFIREHQGYYYMGREARKVTNRQADTTRGNRYWRWARWFSWLIGRFPYVKGVMISGSLSKGIMKKGGDIDYFIVTSPGRLWICRTLLILFKKVFLLNSRKFFCLNHFIDADHLEIQDQNIFTATEIVTAKPVYNRQLYWEFLHQNQWVSTYYPQHQQQNTDRTNPSRTGILKPLAEKLLDGKLGEKLDNWCMQRTATYWQQKFNTADPEADNASHQTDKHLSKQNDFDFQTYVLEQYQQKVSAFEARHQVSLT